MPRIELERHEEVDEASRVSSELFDRLAFAERAIALLRLANTTVAICPGGRRTRLTTGREWGHSTDHRWAILAVSPNASRQAIASAVLELSAHGEPRPWSLDVLLRRSESP